MAGEDWSSLFSNPLFIAGLSGLTAPRGQEGQMMLKGLLAGQQVSSQQQAAKLRQMQMDQMQRQQDFNPQDYMQTQPVQGTATPTALADAMQTPAMPATLGGAGGGSTPMLPPQPMAAPIQPQPGTPTGRVDMQGLLGGALQAGMSPAAAQQMAGIMDPETAIRQQIMLKNGEPYNLGPGEQRYVGGQQVAANTSAPPSSEVAQLQQLGAQRDAALARGDKGNAQMFQTAIDKLSGAATNDFHRQMLDLGQQRVDTMNERLNGNPQDIEKTAQGIANGQLAPLSGFAMRTPQGQAVMNRVLELNPQFSAQDYSTGQAALTAFAKGKQGDTVRSFNVGLDHLNTLGHLATALKNGDMQTFNQVANTVSTLTGNPAPTNFTAARDVVGNEIVKAIVGAGGGVGDREKAQRAIGEAQSPAQLEGVIQTYQKLMTGQLKGLQTQYEQGTKRKDFDRFLSPASKAMLQGGSAPTVVKTGTLNGRKVVQYSDGTTAFAD